MKKFYFFVLLLMGILTAAMAQGPVVSFNCMDDNGNSQRLDSVRIDNWTRSWSVTIYYPNLSISLGDIHTGITELEFDEEGLAQNIPNPFDGRTRAQLTLATSEHILMRVYDMTGRIVAHYEGQLESGKHEFNIVLSTPQTYILQVASSRRNYTIKMVNTGKGGEDKISLMSSEEGEMVLKSAKQIMDYDFEVGDCMNYQGFVTLNGAAVRTEPLVQNQYDSEQITLRVLAQQTTTVPVGVYAGVVGFNNQLYVKPIGLLDNSSINAYHSFINTLPMGNGTILYHADYTALNNIASSPIPDELINVTLVTFTDGLDLGSWRMNPIFTSETAYLNAVHNRIMNDELGGVHITAYAIGVKGSDVTDTARFRYDLRMLSSDPDHNALEVSDISEVNAQFREVAAQLNSASLFTTDITLLLPAPDPGTRVRFTFDNVTSAENSYYYIDATYTFSNGVGILSDIVYEGLTSTSGTMVTGVAQGIFDRFVFTDIKDNLQQQVSTSNIKQWYYVPSTQQWQRNSEFTTSNTTTSQQQHNSAMVMLVLDCSSSLGSGFSTMKSSANNFLDILRNSNTLSAPTVQTQQAITVTDVSANLRGTVTNSGNLIIHEKGFVVSLSPNMSNASYYISSGTSIDFSYSLTGLSPNTTYYYKAYARNNRGIGYGNTQSFTTPTMPSVTTAQVSGVTGYTAVCGGTVTSTGNATATRGVCWSTSQSPTVSDSHTNDGSGSGSYTSTLSNLNPGTTYYVRAYVTNIVGTAYGEQRSFTTSVVLPTVTTNDVTDNVGTTATCGGNVTSTGGGVVTARGICWGTSQNPTISNSHSTNGSGSGSFTSSMVNLTPGTTYYVRAYATNSAGTAYGEQKTFTTPNTPTVTTNTVSSITATTATCGGNVTATGGANVTARGVCWSTSQNPTVSSSHTTDGNGTGSFTSNITGLQPNTTYYVRAYATNSAGTSYGTQRSFTTPVTTPTVTTNNTINNITGTGATTGGNVTATGGASVTARGVCWNTSANPTVSNSHTTNGTGTGSFTSNITGLSPNTTYYVRAYATNSAGTGYGAQLSFSTPIVPPTVSTNTISNITSTSATCGGNVTATGGASVTAKGVCWSTSQNPTTSDSHTTNGSGTGSFTSNITGLTPGTTYYVRAYATNSAGTAYGEQRSLTTPTIPTVTTSSVGSVTGTSASCGGNVTATGGASVTARGVCWSTSQNPTVSGNHTSNGTGTGSFTSSITGLSLGTTYYVRAYATNSVGTAYGEQYSFTTLNTPTVTTETVSDITSTTASCGGDVTADGGASVTAKGVCWSTSQNPTVSGSHTTNGSGTGSFTSNITNLIPGTTYYVRAYATNSVGTAYGTQRTFSTPFVCGGTTGDIDGNIYNTLQLGNQCWMKENLKTTHYANGTSIALGSSTSTSTAYRYNPNNNATNVATYGYLYNWKAVMRNSSSSSANPSNVQGICPNGWHVPSDAEWIQLTDFVSGQSQYICGNDNTNIAKALASSTGWNSSSENCAVGNNPNANNSTGFSALPSGSYTGSYYSFNNGAYLWSTTHGSNSDAYECSVYYANAINGWNYYGTQCAFSVRCLRNDGLSVSLPTLSTTNVSQITNNSAVGGGNITSDGGGSITARGLCWSTFQNPTLNNSHITTGNGTGSFTGNITGLTPGTTYYVRAYATNSVGTAYGNTVSFTTPFTCGGITSDIDGNTYQTLQLGNQCWMKENLRTTHYADGTSIALGSSTNTTTAYRYYPNDDANNVPTYGYLYNWTAVMHGASSSANNPSGVQGICPNGWHVPSDAEWTQLTNYVSGQSQYVCGNNNTNIAKALASIIGWNNSSNDCAVGNTTANNNATGFSALPAGNYQNNSSFGNFANFWSATAYNNDTAYYHAIDYNYTGVCRINVYKYRGFSVRCLRNDGFTVSLPTLSTTTASQITYNSAIGGGNVSSNGGGTIIARGVCWSTSENPTVMDSHTSNGSGIGSFTSNITGLQPGTTYYARAYATNSVGTAYGEQISFTTQITLPTVSTEMVSEITAITAVCGGNVTSTGGADVIARGVCWGISQNPTISNSHTTDGNGSGSFTSNITGLSHNTTYYVRAYATNSSGTAYGEQRSFMTPTVPTVSTTTVSSITGTSAVSGGNVTSDGRATVTARGVCWSTSHNPTTNDSHTTDGTGTGVFTSNLTGLSHVTTYYIRAYATNIVATVYGEELTFTTPPIIPTVSTNTVSSITTSATCGGNVTATGGAEVTERGICWSTTQNPTINDSHTTNGNGTGSYTSNMTGLTHSTTYYVRAYATNSAGTAYGSQKSFTTRAADGYPCAGATTVTDYDNNTYNTVQIGNQCWMKENLKTTHYADGTSIALGNSSSSSTAYRYKPNNNANNVSTYGYLYNWKAVMKNSSSSSANPSGVQGICPNGWHVPSAAEWTQLTNYVSSQSQYVCGSDNTNIAKALASTTGWNSITNTCAVGNNPSANNATGFSVLPAGQYITDNFQFGAYARFWSSKQYNNDYAYNLYIYYDRVGAYGGNNAKYVGYSVRCVKNQ
ncbi:MAG: hypothetical protein IKP54_08345 [Bacteroidales bacterium]|nr:hypothetical protein [Bacteroidales bacterium]